MSADLLRCPVLSKSLSYLTSNPLLMWRGRSRARRVTPAGSFLRLVTIVSRDGSVLGTIGKPGGYNTIQISPDGRSAALLVTDSSNSSSDIWLMDMGRGVPVRFTQSAVSINPLWSPDGKDIIYSSNHGDGYQLFRRPVAGGLPEQPVQPSIRGIGLSWVANPDSVIYRDFEKNSLMLLPLEPGRTPIPIETTLPTNYGAAVSPSGKWVAFASRESSSLEIFVKALPVPGAVPGPKVRVSSAGGGNPVWSADGNELFFNTLDDRLMAAPVKYSGGRIEAGEPKPLFSLGGTSVYNGALYWQPIGNGERFVVLRSEPVASKDNRVNVRINWQARLQTLP
jgi:WD40-like Beta Propeller Repeat